MTSSLRSVRLEPRPLPPNVNGAQPGGGWALRLELVWGWLRRWRLRALRPGYVARMRSLRRGECAACPHDVIDPRDLKFHENVCDHWFAAGDDPFAWRGRLPVARWGWAELLLCGGGAAALTLVMLFAFPWAAPLPALAAIFVAAFFRDPPRTIPAEPGAVVSPADGTVTDVTRLGWLDEFQGPAVRVGIYLTIFNVHVNRCPETARAVAVCYRPGRFLNARHPAAGDVNEQFSTLLECEAAPHRLLLVKQIAGAFASRVVNVVRPGRVLNRGDKLGMIKFGSRTELYLEDVAELQVLVRPGDKVRGGSSVVARYSARHP
ncbi:MAG TPA: phosphatidylserine decarboxylase [Gemmataceae bacterium]|nr:phosphatidylserine decarboxylase [Gemmataceae bacterium]